MARLSPSPSRVFAAGPDLRCALGAIVMLMPGIGETFVPPRVRLALRPVLSLLLGAGGRRRLPPMPADVSGLARAVIKETAHRPGDRRPCSTDHDVPGGGRRDHLDPDHPGLRPDRQPDRRPSPAPRVGTFLGSRMGIVLIMTTNLHHLFMARSSAPTPVPVREAVPVVRRRPAGGADGEPLLRARPAAGRPGGGVLADLQHRHRPGRPGDAAVPDLLRRHAR